MADVFVSYKRQDEPQVHRLVKALQGAGLTVWWDREIALDAAWELTIERELTAAKVVIVAWSPGAVASDNVRAEARRARHAGKLIQVFLEHCDPPLFFGERQGVNLHDWRGNPSDGRFQATLAAVRAMLAGQAPERGVGFQPRKRRLWPMLAPVGLVGAAAVVLVATAGLTRNVNPGLVSAVAAPPDPAALRLKLIDSVAGVWDRPEDACATTLTLSVDTDSEGVSTITLLRGKVRRMGQVTTAEGGVVNSRDVTGASGSGSEASEYHPDGNRMVVVDKDGHDTTLVRCPAKA